MTAGDDKPIEVRIYFLLEHSNVRTTYVLFRQNSSHLNPAKDRWFFKNKTQNVTSRDPTSIRFSWRSRLGVNAVVK